VLDDTDGDSSSLLAKLAEPVQDASDSAFARCSLSEASPEKNDQLAWSPSRMGLPHVDNRENDLLAQRERRAVRSSALRVQAVVALFAKSLQPLVARLASDAELSAKRGHVRPLASPSR
jgi:hypothetical protein